MNRHGLILSVLLIALYAWLGLSILRAEEAAPEKLTWTDCVREASKNNPDIEASWHGWQNAEAVRKGSYSQFFPQVSVSTGFTRSYQPSSASGSGMTEYSSQYSAEATVNQMVFDGFKTKGGVDQAKAQARVALASLAGEKSLVSYELKTAFAQLLFAQELVRISKDIVGQRDLNYRLIEMFYQSGKENKGSLLLSKANLSQAQYELRQAQRNVEVSQRQLQTTMGRLIIRPVYAVGELVTAEIELNPDFKKLALRTPAHFQSSASADASAAGITLAQSTLYPQINASATASRQDSKFVPKYSGWSAGVSASWDLFDGGSTYFNVKAARASLQQSLATLRSTDDQTALSLAEDYKSLVDGVELVKVTEEALAAAALRSRIAQEQYRNGLISFQDFETITNSFISQQRTTLAARRDAVLAEANWEQSRGIGAIP
ncbi:MAG: hypothetical protein B9S32_07875 [Verrucomicrobia bacterium Tous-C9LFEB]|nr:MAG: hypothetical protein B9S32_07875 [Verrucomicrobia bacterium Tous-C9LFEB]